LDSDITFLCGGTPPKADGSIDLFFLEEPAKQLAAIVKEKNEDHLVVIRSTVVPGSIAEIEFHPLPQDDPIRRCPDLRKAKKTLGWQPELGLEEGVKRIIEWMRQPLTTASG
jgi:UDP-glucose 6-dehydrogenase